MSLALLKILLLSLIASTGASFMDLYAGSIRKSNYNHQLVQGYDGANQKSPDLVKLIHSRTAQHDSVFSNAIQLLESMKSSPSCSRIAAMKLLTSCQSLSSSEPSGGAEIADTLDRVKSIYAARLALCELSGAGASIPLSCSSIRIASDAAYDESGIDLVDIADDFSASVVEGCLRGLESRPQWWTSYSNSRQNAIVICQAARIEIEKEEMLNLHQSLAKNAENLNSALQTALRDAAAENAQQRIFMETVYKLRDRLITELQKDSIQASSLFASLLRNFEGVVSSSISKVLLLLKDVEEDSSALSQGMHISITDIEHLRSRINEIYNELERRNSELKDLQGQDIKDMESNHELTLFMQSSLNNLQERVAGVDGALEWLVERFAAVHKQESLILERLQSFETHLEESEARASRLLETQAHHAKAIETQAQAQEALGANTKIVFALLEKLTVRAANLESILEETASKFKDFQEMDGLFGLNISLWTALSLLLTLFAVQNPKMAGIISVFAGFALVSRAISYITHFHLSTFMNRI
ncbi:nuclear membrane fusion protein Kar5, putative [Talaromyces stipitatus ATCC 10500]|uniref:Nuclear membrane fusion protein Kar5, putative n=1 Tax=Talaromyces stipitatus (strain ATCC 10500 / CBS 375.48 / QM 6759 / NRRL 1006) TaxID=441959 RepID=B8LYP4_TALSN|nr:nuclear membrane fusion protein Kar5, putative [Talaromyces stipitatus ATCC 10500]EED23402.1 nuclear membrane fusion protein Kar5, putative [Talaromyces stipitatus ATCC 10500]